MNGLGYFRHRTCSFWCPFRGQAVTCGFRERPADGKRLAVTWCTAFSPPEAVTCAKRCLDDDTAVPTLVSAA